MTLKRYVAQRILNDLENNKVWSYDESLIWCIQDYLASYEPTKEDMKYMESLGLLELLEEVN